MRDTGGHCWGTMCVVQPCIAGYTDLHAVGGMYTSMYVRLASSAGAQTCMKAAQRQSRLGTDMRSSSRRLCRCHTRISPIPQAAKTSLYSCGKAMSCTLLGGDVCSISACSFLLCKHQSALHTVLRGKTLWRGYHKFAGCGKRWRFVEGYSRLSLLLWAIITGLKQPGVKSFVVEAAEPKLLVDANYCLMEISLPSQWFSSHKTATQQALHCLKAQRATHLDVIGDPELVTPMSSTNHRHATAIAVCIINSQGADLGSKLGGCQQGHLVEEASVLPLLIMLHDRDGTIPTAHYDVPCWCHGNCRYALLDQPLGWPTVAQQAPFQVDLQQAEQPA